MLLSFLFATATAAPTPNPVWIPRDDAPDLCVSPVPDAGKMRGKDRKAWAAAAEQVRDGAEPEAWAAAAGAVEGMKDHPAKHALVSTAGLLAGDGLGDLTTLSKDFPYDVCLATTAAWAALDAGAPEQAITIAGRASMRGPHARLAHVFTLALQATGETSRAFDAADKGLKADPSNPDLRSLRARAAVAMGEPERVAADLDWLLERGDRTLEQSLMPIRFAQGDMDAYLALAARDPDLPLAIAPGLAEADQPLQHLRTALGLGGAGEVLVATFVTSEGEIPCELFVDVAPVTVASFVGLATGVQPWTDPRTSEPGDGPLYQDLLFHRIIPGFMAQTGDPAGTGRGGPGYRFHDETNERIGFDRVGRLAMANAGPDTNGSQIFITDGTATHLNGRHTIFGQCGAPEVVATITNSAKDEQDRPFRDLHLERIEIAAKRP